MYKECRYIQSSRAFIRQDLSLPCVLYFHSIPLFMISDKETLTFSLVLPLRRDNQHDLPHPSSSKTRMYILAPLQSPRASRSSPQEIYPPTTRDNATDSHLQSQTRSRATPPAPALHSHSRIHLLSPLTQLLPLYRRRRRRRCAPRAPRAPRPDLQHPARHLPTSAALQPGQTGCLIFTASRATI